MVSTIKERGAIVGARLKEGEDKRFEQTDLRIRTIIGAELTDQTAVIGIATKK
jgi:hypothetical protein